MKNYILLISIALFSMSCQSELMEDVNPGIEITISDTILQVTNKQCFYDCDYYYYRNDSIVDIRMNYYSFDFESSPTFKIKIYRYNDSYVLHLLSGTELESFQDLDITLSEDVIITLPFTAWGFDVGANEWTTRYDISPYEFDLLSTENINRINIPYSTSNYWYAFNDECHKSNIKTQINCTQ